MKYSVVDLQHNASTSKHSFEVWEHEKVTGAYGDARSEENIGCGRKLKSNSNDFAGACIALHFTKSHCFYTTFFFFKWGNYFRVLIDDDFLYKIVDESFPSWMLPLCTLWIRFVASSPLRWLSRGLLSEMMELFLTTPHSDAKIRYYN